MKLLRLDLKAFGPFTERSLNLAGDLAPEHDGAATGHAGSGASLVLIHGPNEAGKSATLRAISDLRFGIPSKSGDDFIHAYKEMRIGGLFEDRDGKRYELVRRKGLNATLSLAGNGTNGTGNVASTLAPAIEALITCGFTKAAHDSMFGLDHQRLREGGEALLKGEGEVGAALFEASAGIRSVPALLETLDQSARKYFMPGSRAKNGLINEALRKHAEQHDGYRKALLRPAAWQTLMSAHQRCDEALKALESERLQLGARQQLIAELRAVAPLFSAIDQATLMLRELDHAVLLAPGAESERAAAQSGLAQAAAAAQDAQEEIERQQGVLRRLPADQAALSAGPAIERLAASGETISRHRAELASLEQELALGRKRAAQLAHGIAAGTTPEALLAAMPAATTRSAIAQALQALERATHDLARQRETMPPDDSAQETELAPPFELADRAALNAARQRLLQNESLLLRKAALPAQISAASRAATQMLADLGLADQAALLRVSPVDTAEIDMAMRALDQHVTRDDELARRLATIARQQAELDERRCGLLANGPIATAAEVAGARAQRDLGWQLVKRIHIAGETDEMLQAAGKDFAAGTGLAPAYESAVVLADRLIDTLARDMQRAEQLLALEREIARLENDRHSLLAERQALEEQASQRQLAWQALLEKAGLPDMAAPALRDWQGRLLKAREWHEQLASQREELGQADAIEKRLAHALGNAIAAITGRAAPDGLPLTELAALADELESGLRHSESRYNTTLGKRQEQTRQRQLAQARLTRLSEEVSSARKTLAPLLASLRLPSDTEPAVAQARLQEFEALLAVQAQQDQLTLGAQRAGAALEQLAGQAEAIASALDDSANLSSQDLRLYAEALAARLEQARKTDTARAMASHALDVAQENQRRASSQQQTHSLALEQLCAAAGVQSASQLPEAEDRSRRKREAQTDIDRATRQLALASRRDMVSLRELLADQDSARLDADEASLTQQQNVLEDSLRSARAAEEKARHDLAAVDSADTAVVFQEGMEQAAAGVRAAIGPWMRSRLAHSLLAQAQRQFRERAQGPMLAGASDYFRSMTAGEFVRLASDDSRDSSAPVLIALRANGQQVFVGQMSEGTRDQLYLALRLAALSLRRQAGIDLPLLLDDVLMTSDDGRAALMLQTLATFSRLGQVIVFTHHAHLLDLARKVVDRRLLQTVEL